MKKTKSLLIGELITEEFTYSLKEVCEICHVHAEVIIEMVEHGVLEPQGKSMTKWRFSNAQMQRSRRALRLQKDLQLNLPGVALSLDLLERIDQLLSRIHSLEKQITLLNKSD